MKYAISGEEMVVTQDVIEKRQLRNSAGQMQTVGIKIDIRSLTRMAFHFPIMEKVHSVASALRWTTGRVSISGL